MTTFDPPSNAEANQTSNSVDLGASKVNALANADPDYKAIKKANQALNDAKVPTEGRQVMDENDPRVFNPLATQTDIRETVDGILENFRVRTLEKQDKGNKRDATEALLALFQARERQFLADIKAGKIPYFEGVVIPERQQQLITEILGELPKKESTEGLPPDHEAIYDRGFNKCRQQVVSVIERLQNKTNDGGN